MAAFVVGLVVLILIAGSLFTWLPRSGKKSSAPATRYYLVLRLVSGLMRVLGWLMVIVGIVVIPIAMQGGAFLPGPEAYSPPPGVGDTPPVLIPPGLTILIAALVASGFVISGILTVAVGELIQLLIHVEKNTRGAEFYSEQTKRAVLALVQAVTPSRPTTHTAPPSSPPRRVAGVPS